MFDLIINSPLFDGEIFGLIDNGILFLLAILGINLDKRLGGSGLNGALFGSLLGNTVSDFVGAIGDPILRANALGITVGCLEVVVVALLYVTIRNWWKSRSESKSGLYDLGGLPFIDDDGKQYRELDKPISQRNPIRFLSEVKPRVWSKERPSLERLMDALSAEPDETLDEWREALINLGTLTDSEKDRFAKEIEKLINQKKKLTDE